MPTPPTRTLGTLGATAALAVLLAAPAAAHTTAQPGTATAGSFGVVSMRVPHGCEGQPTEVLTVRIPEGVVSVKPEQVPGWTAETVIGEYEEPVTFYGEELTGGVVEVRWTADAGEALPDDRYRDFGLSVRFPEEPQELYFPAVQTCTDGSEAAWIEIPGDGDAYDDLEKPAPRVTLTEGAGGHGGDEEASAGTDPTALDATPARSEASSSSGTLGVVLGGLGLLVGLAALLRTRRPA